MSSSSSSSSSHHRGVNVATAAASNWMPPQTPTSKTGGGAGGSSAITTNSQDHPLSPMHVDENEDYKVSSNSNNNSNAVVVGDASKSSSPSSSPPPFRRDERVWAQDPVTSRYYLATIRDVQWKNHHHRDDDSTWSSSSWQFLVHYQGWNSRWDQWVASHQIAAEHETEALRAAGLLSPTKATAAATATSSSTMPPPKEQPQDNRDNTENKESVMVVNGSTFRRKRKNDAELSKAATAAAGGRKRRAAARKATGHATAPESSSSSSSLLGYGCCELPLTLQTVLVDEWERITSSGKNIYPNGGKNMGGNNQPTRPRRLVHSLPAQVTIHQVLKHFAKKSKREAETATAVASVPNNHTMTNDASNTATTTTTTMNARPNISASDIDDFCHGMSQLFQAALPKCLLYHQERPQFHALSNDPVLSKKSYAEIYGCEYLLRLYVRLPLLLPDTNEGTKRSLLGPLLQDLLLLMQKNRQACFKSDYRRPHGPDEWLDHERAAADETAMTTTMAANSSSSKNNNNNTSMEEETLETS